MILKVRLPKDVVFTAVTNSIVVIAGIWVSVWVSLETQNVPDPIKVIEVETLFIGGGPATLGILANAYQTNRLDELIKGVHSLKPGCVINDLMQSSNNTKSKTTVGSMMGQHHQDQIGQ